MGDFMRLDIQLRFLGFFLPWQPMKRILGNPSKFKNILSQNGVALDNAEENGIPFSNMDSFFDWIGLAKYPESEGEGVFFVPRPDDMIEGERMGVTIIKDEKGGEAHF